MNKKRVLILCTISIVIILAVLAFIALKYNKVQFLEKGNVSETNQDVIDEMTFLVYDNTEEKLKTLVRISRENGIDTVEYANENNENVILNCNGKQRVSIDINAELNREYSFLVNSSGNTVTEKFRIDETYMEEYLDRIMNVADILDSEGNARAIGVEFPNRKEGETSYYRLGETRNWIQCTNVGINEIDTSMFDLNDVNNNITLYTKRVDVGGNTLIKKQEIQPKIVSLNVFNDMRVLGTSLQEYGFTSSWANVEEKAFAIGNFQAGHHTDNANWSGTFTWNNPKTYGAKQIYVDFYHYARKTIGYASNASSRIIISYADGTQKTKNNVVTTGTSDRPAEVHCPLILDLDTDKEIRNIQFYLYGYDANYSSSYTRLTNIVLKEIPLPIIEDEE